MVHSTSRCLSSQYKLGKIHVVYSCSASFQDISLNDHPLTGPHLTYTLVGVLCRFRKGPIAIMRDVEWMFHHFHVAKKHQDYQRFLWWDKGDLNSNPSVYRIKVFCADSPPGYSNFRVNHLASQGLGKFSEETIKFIQRSFYVDDGLTSVNSADKPNMLLRSQEPCVEQENICLQKFVSNKKKYLPQ